MSPLMTAAALRQFYCDLNMWPWHKAKLEMDIESQGFCPIDTKDRDKSMGDYGMKEGSRIKVICEEISA